MTRFVEFVNDRGGKTWINAELVCSVDSDTMRGKVMTAIVCRDPDNPHWVTETVPEVMAKLQGDQPAPAKAADDIVGWWVGPMGDIYFVVGRDYWGRYVYQANGYHHLHTETMSYLDNWTRDTDRKGWDR